MPPRILITRSRHQTSDLAARLEALGAEIISIPTIELAPPASFALLDAAIAALSNAEAADKPDWLLFTSANAVQAFYRRFKGLQVELPQTRVPSLRDSLNVTNVTKVGGSANTPGASPTSTTEAAAASGRTFRIAAIGPATARALTEMGLPPDLVPPTAVAESLANALLPHITPGVTSMTLVRAETARDHLPEALSAAGALLTIIPAYRTVIPADSVTELRRLFAAQKLWPHAITFTSSSTATNLLALLEAAGLALPPSILRASIGPITSQTLRDLGLPPHLEAPESNIPSLVQILADHYGLR